MTNKTHILFEDFLENVNLITLKDSKSIKRTIKQNLPKTKKSIETSLKKHKGMKFINTWKTWINDSMFNGKTIEENSKEFSEKFSFPLDVSNEIYKDLDDYLSDLKVRTEHHGKFPLGKWSYHPNDYKGLTDEKYGTAFQCTYIKELKLFFVVIDVDAHHSDKDIPLETIMGAFPDGFLDTRIINTPSNNGKHIYYLSKKPPKARDTPNVNIDYKTIRANQVKKNKDSYETMGQGGYVVSSFRWDYNGRKKEEYVWDETSNKDILVVDDVDEILNQIYTNLNDSGDISDEDYSKLMETNIETNVESIVDDIAIVSDKNSNNNKVSLNERNDSPDKKDSLKYDDNGLLLLNSDNGIILLSEQVGNILKKTRGKHRPILMGLDGGLERLGFPPQTRETILFNGLNQINDLTTEHKSQIRLSSSKDISQRKKIGFPTIIKEAPEVEGELKVIKHIRQLFWRSVSQISYDLMEIPFIEIVDSITPYINQEECEDEKFDEFIWSNISYELDSYLEMMGVGLNERGSLLKYTFLKWNDDSSAMYHKYISNKLNHGDENYGTVRMGTNILPYKRTSFGKRVKDTLSIKDKNGELVSNLDNLVTQLDIQVSLMERKRGGLPYIQPLINLIERPRGFPEYKRRQTAAKFLRDNDYLKRTERHSYIFDSVNEMAYIPINKRSLGNFLSRKYPILKLGIEDNELDNILSISNEFDELKNEYYLFNNGVLNLHTREFHRTKDFHDFFSIKKMDCEYYSDLKPLDLNPLNSEPHCLFDKLLREITIPNYEPFNPYLDSGNYLDCLERIGSCFNTRIKDKKFVCYHGKGDNGKGIIIEILKILFGKRFLLCTMETIQDDKLDLSEYDVLVIDELDEFSFDEAIAFIKRITGGEEDGTAQREHYTHEAYIPKNPSAFFLFTNKIPQVDLSDDAFYRREDVIKLENKFITNPNPTKPNEFQEDTNLKDKMKTLDDNSFEWLINASLQAYYQKHDENGKFLGFSKGQTSAETKMIVSDTDPLTKFLMENYVPDETKENVIKNSILCESYKLYCNRNNITFHPNGINANMGKAVRRVFGEIKIKRSDGNYYSLKPRINKGGLSDDEIIFLPNDSVEWDEVNHKIPSKETTHYFGVYTRITESAKTNSPLTKRQIKREFGMYNIEGILSKMLNIELIYQSEKMEDVSGEYVCED